MLNPQAEQAIRGKEKTQQKRKRTTPQKKDAENREATGLAFPLPTSFLPVGTVEGPSPDEPGPEAGIPTGNFYPEPIRQPQSCSHYSRSMLL